MGAHQSGSGSVNEAAGEQLTQTVLLTFNISVKERFAKFHFYNILCSQHVVLLMRHMRIHSHLHYSLLCVQ